MRNNERIENSLKEIYMSVFEKGEDFPEIDSETIRILEEEGYIRDEKLTEKGIERAKKIIRLHRLAERLLNDVLKASDKEIESSACRFEHVISEEVEEAICTLLGHPSVCPHGRPIPPGDCCLRGEDEVKSLVVRLTALSPGEDGEVKYLTGDESTVKKLISLGILPGRRIRVLRVYPAYLIQMGNSQIALDENIANGIHVMRI